MKQQIIKQQLTNANIIRRGTKISLEQEVRITLSPPVLFPRLDLMRPDSQDELAGLLKKYQDEDELELYHIPAAGRYSAPEQGYLHLPIRLSSREKSALNLRFNNSCTRNN